MKKTKGARRRKEGELDELRSDELCGAVMEGLSDDYLGYISKLMKQSKTPAKAVESSSSSDEKPKAQSNPIASQLRSTPRGPVHSRPLSTDKEPPPKASKRVSTVYVSSCEEPHFTPADRLKPHTPSKLFISDIDTYLLKLQDKSEASYSTKQQTRKKYKQSPKEIECVRESRNQSREHSVSHSINNRDSRNHKDKKQFFDRSREKAVKQSTADTYEIMKENLKLKKKIRSYEDKIEQLQQEVSEHLMQCKKRDNGYKAKIGELIKLLDHASGKIGEQKRQVQGMKGLLKSFGKKARHIEREETEDDLENQIRDSLLQIMRQPISQPTKNKKGFNQTLLKKEQNW